MRISLIYAVSRNNIIGNNGKLPWLHISSDLKRFNNLTKNSVVIMGRKTWESLPESKRPLPDRINIVVSETLANNNINVQVVRTLDEALKAAQESLRFCMTSDVFVIGGKALLEEAYSRAEQIYITKVNTIVNGDVEGPVLDLREKSGWRLTEAESCKDIYSLSFSKYERLKT